MGHPLAHLHHVVESLEIIVLIWLVVSRKSFTIALLFFAELSGALRAIEIASQHNWSNLWLELDSALVVLAFKKNTLIPWALRNRWFNVQLLMRNMNVIVTHIYREGNECADYLANIGLGLVHFTFWTVLPSALRCSFVKNKLGMPSFRFTSF
jgi:hypothetical protein